VFADINAQLQSIASQSGLVLTCLLWFCNDRLEDMTETSIASRHWWCHETGGRWY